MSDHENQIPDACPLPEPPEHPIDCESPDASQASGLTVLGILREVVQTFLLALLLAFLLRFFLMDTYLIDGPSMEPSLLEGERLLVNKIVYQFRDPNPGEVVVFREPGREHRNLVKRVVAVAGQMLEIRQGQVWVDGYPIAEDYIAYAGTDVLPPQQIPANTLFVMGDNRSNSWDSRYFGAISRDMVRGKAFFVFWPLPNVHLLGTSLRVTQSQSPQLHNQSESMFIP